MNRKQRGQIFLGLILLGVGAWLLAQQFIPALRLPVNELHWPVWVIGAGVVLFLFGLLVGAPAMAVPAVIVGGIGGLLYWQSLTGNWGSWAYAWSLILGFVGLGILLAGALKGRLRENLDAGFTLIVISLILFIVFGAMLGGNALLATYWPVLLIILGVWLLLRPLFHRFVPK